MNYLSLSLLVFGSLTTANATPSHFSLTYAPPPLTRPAMVANYDGHLDFATCQSFDGWASDRLAPNVSIQVDIYIDDNFVQRITADRFRSDIGAVMNDNGLHGYSFPVPAQYQTGNHTVTAKFGNTTQNLGSTPKTISCGGNPPPPPPPNPGSVSLNPYSGDAYFINGVVGIGTTNVGDRGSLLSVRGRIRAQEVRIENANWPDYVFDPAYKLPALPSLEAYLNTHHHLPGIPSAQDVARNGVLLGDMNARLLEKVEELTLQQQFPLWKL